MVMPIVWGTPCQRSVAFPNLVDREHIHQMIKAGPGPENISLVLEAVLHIQVSRVGHAPQLACGR